MGWFENSKLNHAKDGTRCLLQGGLRDWDALGTSPLKDSTVFLSKTVAEVMDAKMEGEEELHPSKRQRVAELVPFPVLSEVEPLNRDFDVNEFSRSSPNPVVAREQQSAEEIPA